MIVLKKKVLGLVLGMGVMMVQVGFASPLTTFVGEDGRGIVQVEGSLGQSSLDAFVGGSGFGLDGGEGFSLSVTGGVDENSGLQYKKNYYPSSSGGSHLNIRTQEVNYLQKLPHSDAVVIVGGLRSGAAGFGGRATEDSLQVGVTGSRVIGDNTRAYGTFMIGEKLTSYEAGVSYGVSRDMDVNASYRIGNYRGFDDGVNRLDATVKGVSVGLSLKF